MTHSIKFRHDERSLVVFDSKREWVFAADPLGRMVWIHTPEVVYRRSRFDHWYAVKRGRWPYLESVEATRIAEGVEQWKAVWQRAKVPDGLGGILRAWAERFMDFHREDAERFRSIFQHIPIVPPDAYQALYVQLSVGCPWNRCLFCGFYRDHKYAVRSEDDLAKHLLSARSYWEGALGSRSGIFLGDANAMAIPADVLEDRCRLVSEVFPENQFHAFHSFSDVLASRQRLGEDFSRLRRLGLHRICFGVESGDENLLSLLQKPMKGDDVYRAVGEALRGGIQVSLIFIVGLGGRRYRDSHFEASLDLLSRLPLARPDRIYLSPLTLEPGLGYHEAAAEQGWDPLSDEDVDAEMSRWAEAISRAHPRLPVSLYNIRKFTY